MKVAKFYTLSFYRKPPMTAFIFGFPAVLVTVHPHYLDPLSMEGTPGFKKEPPLC